VILEVHDQHSAEIDADTAQRPAKEQALLENGRDRAEVVDLGKLPGDNEASQSAPPILLYNINPL